VHHMYSVIIYCMPSSTIMTLRVDSKLKKKLDKLAKTTQRSRSFLAAEAIREYVTLNEWQIEEIEKAIRQADAGDFATDEEVEEMFKKWAKRAR
jgi:RHH-type rel operon transcriptional repressor/antitoxin RelB